MLKIKDESSLNKLENFGFVFDAYSGFYFHKCGWEIYAGDKDTRLELELAWDEENFNLEYCLDVLFDIIKADLVEKCDE